MPAITLSSKVLLTARNTDEAVKGVTEIIHAASPLSGSDPTIDPKVIIEPAVQGTLGISRSAQQTDTIERVIITSSISSIWDSGKQLPSVFTEEMWNEGAIKIVEQQGSKSPPFMKYSASKTLAERAAWDFVREQATSFDLVAILPSSNWGEVVNESNPSFKGSNTQLLTPLTAAGQELYRGNNLLKEWPFVDVRDVAKLHVDALVLPVAGGQHFMASAQTITVQHIYDILSADPVKGVSVQRDEPELLDDWKPKTYFSKSKSEDALGMCYRTTEETITNTIVHALMLGWKQRGVS